MAPHPMTSPQTDSVQFEAAAPRITLRNHFAHPFYNSEQQSQRYVRLTHALAYLPPESPGFGAAEREIYERAVARAWGYYRELTALLQGDARDILGDIWHISPISHPKRVQKVDRQAEKRAIEVARYVLPVAAATTMVHTLSGIVLHRLWRMAAASDTPAESRAVIGEMVARVREIDPQFFDRFGNAPMEQEEMPEWSHTAFGPGHAGGVADLPGAPSCSPENAEAFAQEFDA